MSTFISSEPDIGPSLVVDDVERHVAWFYATAVRRRRGTPLSGQRIVRLVRQILAETEAFNTLLAQLTVTELDGDAAIDVAGVLARALDQWRVALTKWRGEARYRALAVSAAHLVDVAERLLDALASAAWPREREGRRGALRRRFRRRTEVEPGSCVHR